MNPLTLHPVLSLSSAAMRPFGADEGRFGEKRICYNNLS
jgi:hypothetical protein